MAAPAVDVAGHDIERRKGAEAERSCLSAAYRHVALAFPVAVTVGVARTAVVTMKARPIGRDYFD
jgi:hypothetical protein